MMNPYIQTNNGTVRGGGLKLRGKIQRKRVQHGLKNGSIDQAELDSLKQMRTDVRTSLSEAKASDGYVNIQERVALHQDITDMRKAVTDFKWG